jgi:hypothetical protein
MQLAGHPPAFLLERNQPLLLALTLEANRLRNYCRLSPTATHLPAAEPSTRRQ